MVSNYATATIKQKLFMRERHEPCTTQKLSRGEETLVKPFAISDSGSHLEIQVILRLLHLWSTKTPVGKAQDELKVCRHSFIVSLNLTHLSNTSNIRSQVILLLTGITLLEKFAYNTFWTTRL